MSKIIEMGIEIRNHKAFQKDMNDKKGKAEIGIKGVTYPETRQEFIKAIKRHIVPEASYKLIIQDNGKVFGCLTASDLTDKGKDLYFGVSYSTTKKYKKNKVTNTTVNNWLNEAAIDKFIK